MTNSWETATFKGQKETKKEAEKEKPGICEGKLQENGSFPLSLQWNPSLVIIRECQSGKGNGKLAFNLVLFLLRFFPGIWGSFSNFFFFWLCHVARRILVPWPGIEPGSSAAEAQSPNHWTALMLGILFFFLILIHFFISINKLQEPRVDQIGDQLWGCP